MQRSHLTPLHHQTKTEFSRATGVNVPVRPRQSICSNRGNAQPQVETYTRSPNAVHDSKSLAVLLFVRLSTLITIPSISTDKLEYRSCCSVGIFLNFRIYRTKTGVSPISKPILQLRGPCIEDKTMIRLTIAPIP